MLKAIRAGEPCGGKRLQPTGSDLTKWVRPE